MENVPPLLEKALVSLPLCDSKISIGLENCVSTYLPLCLFISPNLAHFEGILAYDLTHGFGAEPPFYQQHRWQDAASALQLVLAQFLHMKHSSTHPLHAQPANHY